MEYNLNHPKRREIFKQFLKNEVLRFSQLEKATKMRSNELAYFIEKLSREGILNKKGEFYSLSENAEKYIPFFIDDSKKLRVLPVVLVACVNKDKVLLVKRKKRPYLGKWGFIGGRLLFNERIKDSSLRLLEEKAFSKGSFVKINGILHEKYENGSLKHGYLLILTTVNVKKVKESENNKWFDLKKLEKSQIIPSDLWMIENLLDRKLDIPEEILVLKNGKIKLKFFN